MYKQLHNIEQEESFCKRQFVETYQKIIFVYLASFIIKWNIWGINELKQGLWYTISLSYKCVYGCKYVYKYGFLFIGSE